VLTLYDAARCPYCARVRIVLAEKGIEYEPVPIDLDDRPDWIYEKNPTGRVPVLEGEDGFVLPESAVIMEYLEELHPEPALLPKDPVERALARVTIFRFEKEFSTPYYAARRDPANRPALEAALLDLEQALTTRDYLGGVEFGLADIAYAPWVMRIRAGVVRADLDQYPALSAWLDRLAAHPSIAAERGVVQALVR
jgi:stringent starvation protein A